MTFDANGTPSSLSVALSEGALNGLPQTPLGNGNPAASLVLALPAEAHGAAFDRATLDWHPQGHDPSQVYGTAHFAINSYLIPVIPVTDQRATASTDPQFAAKPAPNAPRGPRRPARSRCRPRTNVPALTRRATPLRTTARARSVAWRSTGRSRATEPPPGYRPRVARAQRAHHRRAGRRDR